MTYTPTEELARIIDPEAFEDHPIESRSSVAAIQWAARRKWAADAAEKVLPWLAAHDAQVQEAQRQSGAKAPLQLYPLGSLVTGDAPDRIAAAIRDNTGDQTPKIPFAGPGPDYMVNTDELGDLAELPHIHEPDGEYWAGCRRCYIDRLAGIPAVTGEQKEPENNNPTGDN